MYNVETPDVLTKIKSKKIGEAENPPLRLHVMHTTPCCVQVMEKLQMKQHPRLIQAWNNYCKQIKEADKIYSESREIFAKGNKSRSEGWIHYADGEVLFYKSCLMKAEAKQVWCHAVKSVHNNIMLFWHDAKCLLENGEEYIPEVT